MPRAEGFLLLRSNRPGVLRGVLLVLAAAPAAILLALAVAIYPVTTTALVVLFGVAVLAWRAPSAALVAAILFFEFEGTIKIALGQEHSPLPGDARFAGAFLLDLALAMAVAGVLWQDRLRTPRAVWARARRPERAAILTITAWLALSVAQIAQGGDLSRGLQGFRLFQWYALVALATLAIFFRDRRRATTWFVAAGAIVCAYAALRIAIGPSDAERAFALSVNTVTEYGQVFRAVGSFSSAIGLSSFVAPMAAFSLVLGLFVARMRTLAWTAGALALVATVGSFSRASLFGLALGLACAVVAIVGASGMSRRRSLIAFAVMLGIVGASYGGVYLASRASPRLRERASGILDPLNDPSVRLRFDTWSRSWDSAVEHPLGQGLGAVGSASSSTRARLRTTDNSFLKVLVDQGFEGLLLFAGGLIASVLLLTRRLRRADAEARSLGVAALAGFITFLGMAFAGETVEQPGKVFAWALLGIAVACAFGRPEHDEGGDR